MPYSYVIIWGKRKEKKRKEKLKTKKLPYLCFWCKTSHERSCSITGIVFLYKTNGGVDDKKGNNTDEVLPIRGLVLQKKKIINK